MCDTYVVAGSTDHIIPWDGAYRTTQLLGGDSRVRAELERSHPGHRQPAGQSEGVVPHLRRAPADRGRSGSSASETHGIVVGALDGVARRPLRRPTRPRRRTLGNAAHPRLEPAPGTVRPPAVDGPASRSSASTGTSLRVSVRGEGRRSCSSWASAATSRCGTRSSARSTNAGFQTIAYDASGTGESPPRLVPLRLHGLARQAAHLLDALGLPERRRPRRVVRRRCRAGAHPAQSASRPPAGPRVHDVRPRWRARHTRSRSRCSRRRCATTRRAFLQADVALDVRPGRRRGRPGRCTSTCGARRSRPPTLWGYLGQLYAVAGWTSLPWLHRITRPTLVAHRRARTRSCRRSTRGSSAPASPTRPCTIVPDAGHLLLMDHADECADLITGFLRGDETET